MTVLLKLHARGNLPFVGLFSIYYYIVTKEKAVRILSRRMRMST